VDVSGNIYTFNAKTADDLGTWIDTIAERLRALTTQVIKDGETIRFRSLISIERSTGDSLPTSEPAFSIVTVNKSHFRLDVVGLVRNLLTLAH